MIFSMLALRTSRVDPYVEKIHANFQTIDSASIDEKIKGSIVDYHAAISILAQRDRKMEKRILDPLSPG